MEELLTTRYDHTNALLGQCATHTRPVSVVCFAPGGRVMATASWDRSIALGSPDREREVKTLSAHGDIVSGCRFLPDGGTLLSWSHDQTLRLWDVERGESTATLQ